MAKPKSNKIHLGWHSWCMQNANKKGVVISMFFLCLPLLMRYSCCICTNMCTSMHRLLNLMQHERSVVKNGHRNNASFPFECIDMLATQLLNSCGWNELLAHLIIIHGRLQLAGLRGGWEGDEMDGVHY